MEMKADVIVPADQDVEIVDRCVRAVLVHSGTTLGRLFVIDDAPANSDACPRLDRLTVLDSRVIVLPNPAPLGFIGCCNRGLKESHQDVVLLACDNLVGPGWLRELSLVAHLDERTAGASPLAEKSNPCSAAALDGVNSADSFDSPTVNAACAGLPRFTVLPAPSGSCIYLRRDRIDAVGLLDSSLDDAATAIDDWVMRAQELGFFAKRANHVYVRRPKRVLRAGDSANDANRGHPVLKERHPHFERQVGTFRRSLDGQLVSHAVRVEGTGKLRVAYDIRHLPKEQVGTRTYALSLGQALADLPEIELTLLVRYREQARGLKGRVVIEQDWADDVAVIHKPAQVIEPAELTVLFGSNSHVVITYQDLIGYRIPLAFPDDQSFERYRATSSLTLQATQRIVAISRNAASEISAEFGIPSDEIAVVHHGVESSWFGERADSDLWVRRGLGVPDRYFFSLATDFPHKNLPNLLEAYAIMRERWRDGEPPDLVLAGYTSSARAGFYPALASNRPGSGIVFLGPVSRSQLRVLYQHALAFVFPSLYEGFGLTPLEAMAAATPVIAMPISAVPEVVGDCALYPDGLSAASLARALETLARDGGLRDELCSRGLKHVEKFRWENTARATFDVYRSAVLRPSERSLRMRRLLRDVIMHWADPQSVDFAGGPRRTADDVAANRSIGIRNAWSALNVALATRLGRELRRFRPKPRRARGTSARRRRLSQNSAPASREQVVGSRADASDFAGLQQTQTD